MKVYIVNYKGTIYGVFDSAEKALAYANNTWGELAVKQREVNILVHTVL